VAGKGENTFLILALDGEVGQPQRQKTQQTKDQRGRCLFVNEQGGDPFLLAFLKGLL
jgi:hypothetical protein